MHPFAHRVDGGRVIDLDVGPSDDVGRRSRPVLEGVLDEVRDRHDQPAEVPETDDDVGERDLLDPTPLLLDHHHVVHADGLAEGDLETGHDVGHRGPGRQPGHDADDAGRREQARAGDPSLLEAQQDHGDGEHRHGDDGDPTEDLDLGVQLAGPEVVGRVEAVPVEEHFLEHVGEADHEERHGADDPDPDGVQEHGPQGRRHAGEGDPDLEAGERHDQAGGELRVAHERACEELARPSEHPSEDREAERVESDRADQDGAQHDQGHRGDRTDRWMHAGMRSEREGGGHGRIPAAAGPGCRARGFAVALQFREGSAPG